MNARQTGMRVQHILRELQLLHLTGGHDGPPAREHRVVVQGVNIIHKALRPSQANPNGGIDTFEGPIDVSNVMLVCPQCGLPTRIAVRRDEGKKVRVCKKCGKDID